MGSTYVSNDKVQNNGCQDTTLVLSLFCGDLIEVICPPLHHLAAFRQVLGVIVGSSHFIAFTMCKLPFDDIRGKPMLIQDSAGGTAKPVSSGA